MTARSKSAAALRTAARRSYGCGAIGIKEHEIARSNAGATYCDHLIDGSHVSLGRSRSA